VRWPPACEDVSPGAEERPQLSRLRVAAVKNEKLVADTGEPRGRGVSAVGSSYQTTASED
jgi:hypothetical protein